MEVCLGGSGPLELESGAWLRATERPKLTWKEGTPDLDIVLFSMGSYSVGSGHGWLAVDPCLLGCNQDCRLKTQVFRGGFAINLHFTGLGVGESSSDQLGVG